MLVLTTCPEPDCGAQAEVTDMFALSSTGGPMEHAKVSCLFRHWFILPVGRLASPPLPERNDDPRTLQRP